MFPKHTGFLHLITANDHLPSAALLHLAFSYVLLAMLGIFCGPERPVLGHVYPSFKRTHLFVTPLMYPGVSQAAFCCSLPPPT